MKADTWMEDAHSVIWGEPSGIVKYRCTEGQESEGSPEKDMSVLQPVIAINSRMNAGRLGCVSSSVDVAADHST